MLNIRDKANDVNDDTGFLFANEFNSLKNEILNVVKYRSTLSTDTEDTKQVLSAIVTESKLLHYTDTGTVNNIVLNRENEVDFKLLDGSSFMFTANNTNTDIVKVKVGTHTDIPVKVDGQELPASKIVVGQVYLIVYKFADRGFELKNIGGGAGTSNVLDVNSTYLELTADELASDLVNNDVVYISQSEGKYTKAVKRGEDNECQNVIGIYKNINGRHYVIVDGIVHDFKDALRYGNYYYLSTTAVGDIAIEDDSHIIVGRALKNKKFILNISGAVSVAVEGTDNGTGGGDTTEYDTHVNNGETRSGNTFTDPSDTLTLNFDAKTVDGTIPTIVAYVKAGDTTAKIDYATEYSNQPYSVNINSNVYRGTFTENEDYNNPTILQ